MRLGTTVLAVALALSMPVLADDPPHGGVGGAPMVGGGHFQGAGGTWVAHPGWQGSTQHIEQWRGGHWWRGTYGGRFGSWWIVGPDWYRYPVETAPIPDYYTPPDMAPGYWYWCDTYQQYYPFVGACPSGWRAAQPL
jgi:hypothetical protein